MITFKVRHVWGQNPASLAERLCGILGGNGKFNQLVPNDPSEWNVCTNTWFLRITPERGEKGAAICTLNYRYWTGNWNDAEKDALKTVIEKFLG